MTIEWSNNIPFLSQNVLKILRTVELDLQSKIAYSSRGPYCNVTPHKRQDFKKGVRWNCTNKVNWKGRTSSFCNTLNIAVRSPSLLLINANETPRIGSPFLSPLYPIWFFLPLSHDHFKGTLQAKLIHCVLVWGAEHDTDSEVLLHPSKGHWIQPFYLECSFNVSHSTSMQNSAVLS